MCRGRALCTKLGTCKHCLSTSAWAHGCLLTGASSTGSSMRLLAAHYEVVEKMRYNVLFVKYRVDSGLKLRELLHDILHERYCDERLPEGDANYILLKYFRADVAHLPNVSCNTAGQHPSKRETYIIIDVWGNILVIINMQPCPQAPPRVFTLKVMKSCRKPGDKANAHTSTI